MKRVLLISSNTLERPYPAPPIGVCLVAASIEKYYDVRIHDMLTDATETLERMITSFQPHYIGLGIRNVDEVVMDGGKFFIDEIGDKIVTVIRQLTDVPLILGGSGFTLLPRDIMLRLNADWGIIGEAERSFRGLLHALDNGKNPRDVSGVIDKTGYCRCSDRADQINLGSLPESEIDVRLDYTRYRVRGAYPIQTKRGCRQSCVYCPYPVLEGNILRFRSIPAVLDEIESAANRLGDVTFEFVDATFNDPPDHAEALCKAIIKRGWRIRFRTMGLNPAYLTPRLIDLMMSAGFRQSDITPDSASPSILRSLNKNFGRPELEIAAKTIHSRDFPTMWFFIFGGPGETKESIMESFDFINHFIGAENMVHITEGLRIYPYTRIHEIAIAQGIIRAGESLLKPRFYISPDIGPDSLQELVRNHSTLLPNCVRATDSAPSPEMLEKALRLQSGQGLDEPLFRTLLRLRRESGGLNC